MMTCEERLAGYEAMQREVEHSFRETEQKLIRLKAEGKIKTVTYRELLNRKYYEQTMLDLYARYGLREKTED